MVFRFSRWHLSLALRVPAARQLVNSACRQVELCAAHGLPSLLNRRGGPHSLVMKLMNSDTHSCTVSFASFAILAFGGSAFFIILLMLAIGRKRSCSRTLPPRSSPSSASIPGRSGCGVTACQAVRWNPPSPQVENLRLYAVHCRAVVGAALRGDQELHLRKRQPRLGHCRAGMAVVTP